jgi:hypothetical protein
MNKFGDPEVLTIIQGLYAVHFKANFKFSKMTAQPELHLQYDSKLSKLKITEFEILSILHIFKLTQEQCSKIRTRLYFCSELGCLQVYNTSLKLTT